MRNYEAMCIVKPDLSETANKELFAKIKETIEKNKGKITSADIWSEKRKLFFPIKKHKEGVYYLACFSADAKVIAGISHEYKLNEDILRVLITVVG